MGFISVFAGSIALLLPVAIDEAKVLKSNIPGYSAHFKFMAMDVQKKAENKYPALKEKQIIDNSVAKVQKAVENETAKLPQYILNAFSLFSLLVLIPVLTLFMLLTGDGLFNTLFEIVPPKFIETTMGLIYEADSMLGRYLRGQLIETAFVGTLSIVGLMILKVDYAVIIGSLAGFGNMVPYLGPFVGLVLALLVGVVKYQTVAIVVKILILFAIIQFLDNNFVQPVVLGGSVDISPVPMVFALMAGGQLFGLLGMIFAVPAAGVLKTIFKIFFKPPRVQLKERLII